MINHEGRSTNGRMDGRTRHALRVAWSGKSGLSYFRRLFYFSIGRLKTANRRKNRIASNRIISHLKSLLKSISSEEKSMDFRNYPSVNPPNYVLRTIFEHLRGANLYTNANQRYFTQGRGAIKGKRTRPRTSLVFSSRMEESNLGYFMKKNSSISDVDCPDDCGINLI